MARMSVPETPGHKVNTETLHVARNPRQGGQSGGATLAKRNFFHTPLPAVRGADGRSPPEARRADARRPGWPARRSQLKRAAQPLKVRGAARGAARTAAERGKIQISELVP